MTKDEYERKKAEVDRKIEILFAEKTALAREYALTLTDIRVGDTIEFGYNKRCRAVVVGVDLCVGSPRYVVHRIKKDGSVSDYQTDVYSYHKPKKIEQ